MDYKQIKAIEKANKERSTRNKIEIEDKDIARELAEKQLKYIKSNKS